MKRIVLILLAAFLLPTAAAQGKLVDDPEGERIARKLFRAAGMRTIPCPADANNYSANAEKKYAVVCGVSTKTAEFEEFRLHWKKAVKKTRGKVWDPEDKEWRAPDNGFHWRTYHTENGVFALYFRHAFAIFQYSSMDWDLDTEEP